MNKSIKQLNKEVSIEFCLSQINSQERNNFTEIDSVKSFLKKHKTTRYNIYIRARHSDGRRSLAPSSYTIIQGLKSFNDFIESDEFAKRIEVWIDNPIWQEIAHPINRHGRN